MSARSVPWRVLVADDACEIRDLLGVLLRRAGYKVSQAREGGEVLREAVRSRVDLVLLDLAMPETDGWAAMAQLEVLCPRTPVLVVSAYVERDELVRLRERRNVVGVVKKPFRPTELLGRIQAALTAPAA